MTRTVFVSSTFVDLQIHRKAVWEILQKFDVTVRGMEQFGARTETPLQTCIWEVDQSDIYVGIIGFRLGSVESSSGKSYTQLEYERAHALSKEIFIYLVDEQNALVPRRFIDGGEAMEKLESFKGILRERHTIETYLNESDLVEKLARDLKRHVDSREPSKSDLPENEDAEARSRLRQYSILPKSVSGTEVRVKLKIQGKLYPVSKSVCEAFNMEFGATAGCKVDLVSPTDTGLSDIPDLLWPAKILLEALPLGFGDSIECYVKTHFSSNGIGK